ncbi:MAG: hypothetical protein ACR2GY_11545 [Phycisphaerales bacterium]
MEDFKQELDPTWYGQTVLHPYGLAAVILLGLIMIFLPRRYAIVPMIIMACFISPAQRLVVASLDFDMLRIMILFGWTRVVVRGEVRSIDWKWIDLLMIAMAIIGTIAYSALFGTTSALTNRLGWAYELLGMYFLFRLLVRDWADMESAIVGFVVVSIPVAIFFAIELATKRNLFGLLGGVPTITQIRGGRLRCQGAFAHPILAGCFYASLIPMMAALWWRDGRGRMLAVIGLACSGFVILACSSSTPLMAVVFVAVGFAMIVLRSRMGMVCLGLVVLTIALDFAMNKPVYHLIARLNIFASSTGWHRYNLIHQAVTHFGDWWLIGTRSTDHWGIYDITNQYILIGLRGGFLTMMLFIGIIVCAFRGVGRLWRLHADNRYRMIMSWALGVALFTHVMSFISVSYFGQIEMVWYLLLASIASLSPTAQTLRAQQIARARSRQQGMAMRHANVPHSAPAYPVR